MDTETLPQIPFIPACKEDEPEQESMLRISQQAAGRAPMIDGNNSPEPFSDGHNSNGGDFMYGKEQEARSAELQFGDANQHEQMEQAPHNYESFEAGIDLDYNVNGELWTVEMIQQKKDELIAEFKMAISSMEAEWQQVQQAEQELLQHTLDYVESLRSMHHGHVMKRNNVVLSCDGI